MYIGIETQIESGINVKLDIESLHNSSDLFDLWMVESLFANITMVATLSNSAVKACSTTKWALLYHFNHIVCFHYYLNTFLISTNTHLKFLTFYWLQIGVKDSWCASERAQASRLSQKRTSRDL
jgi:hypothetical protein